MKNKFCNFSKKLNEKNKPFYFLFLVLLVISILQISTFNTDANFNAIFLEQQCSGYSARAAALGFGWDSDGGWFQPGCYMPVSTLLSYLSFKLFGIGQWQFRLPFFILNLLSLWLLSLIILRLYELVPALFGVIAFCTSPFLLSLYDSTITEILYFPLFSCIFYILIKKTQSNRTFFLLGLLGSLTLLIKIDAIIIYFAISSIVLLELFKKECSDKIRKIALFVAGTMIGIILLLLYFISTVGIESVVSFYSTYSKNYAKPNWSGVDKPFFVFLWNNFIAFNKNLYIFNPFFYIPALSGLFFVIFTRKKLSLIIKFSAIFFIFYSIFIFFATPVIYYKRFIILIPPFYFLRVHFVSKILNHLNNSIEKERLKLSLISASAILVCLLAFFFLLFRVLEAPLI